MRVKLGRSSRGTVAAVIALMLALAAPGVAPAQTAQERQQIRELERMLQELQGRLGEMQAGEGEPVRAMPEGILPNEWVETLNWRSIGPANMSGRIIVFAVHPVSGRLTYLEHEPTQGRTPRSFGIDPTGQYLLACNQNSGTIVTLRIDQQSGRLTATGHSIKVPTPVCVRFP